MENKYYRIELMNALIKRFGYRYYLEIGTRNRVTFDNIIIEHKCGVDPNPLKPIDYKLTSDEFFLQNKNMFDIIFIDGLHIDYQVTKDVYNSLQWLNSNGTIVLHDCNPLLEEHQNIEPISSTWYGTVWKAWVRLHQILPLEMFVVDVEYGIGIIKDTGCYKRLPLISEEQLTFDNFVTNRKEWLNLISIEEFNSWLYK